MAGSGPPTYISALQIGPEEAAKLRALGADTPQQLLAQIRAAPAAFTRYLGTETARRIERALSAMVPSDEPTEPIPPPGQLGVPLGPAPSNVADSKVDLARRDELFNRIQRLKAEHAPAHQVEAAERALDDLFQRSS
jgi:hypothetical protein